ncbi:MAG: sterol desaturase family protein [Deltaproteobacteria bacterium]|nr:sterol desaturase family protein [Deltaproteobacteria bacterium]
MITSHETRLGSALYGLIFFGTAALLVAGLGQGWSYVGFALPLVLGHAAVVGLLERLSPFHRPWNQDQGDRIADRIHYAANLLVGQASLGLYGIIHVATGAPSWGLAGLPFGAAWLVGLVLFDLGLYAVHRWSHGGGLLWRLHAVHHSSTRIYMLNGQRRHVVHEILEGLPGLMALLAAGAPPAVVAAVLGTVTVHLAWQHSNIAYRLGALRHIIAGAESHRWHHQRQWRDVQGNYAAVLAPWDRLFKTDLRRATTAPTDVGMDDEPALPKDWVGQHVWPFRPHG